MLCLFSCLQLCIQVLNFILHFARFFISIAEVKGSNPIQVWIRLSFRKFCKSCVYKVATIILHLILHSAVHIYGFHIFKTYVYSVRCHKNLFEKYIQKEVKIGIFHAISGESQSYWDGWKVFFMWEEDKRTKYWRDVFIVDTIPKWVGFFLPRSHIGQDSGFHAISGESRSDWDGWTVFFMWEEDKRTKY